jgi:large subunit ribosomal protein L5
MTAYVPRLQEKYRTQIVPVLMRDLGLSNPFEVPKLVKVTVNMGVGEATQNPKLLESAAAELALITGQKPVITRAKKSIATFKLRQGVAIGAVVTLRRFRMYEFLDRLFTLALPRVRDFRGLNPRAFDGRGNYTLGIREQIVFPEIDYDKIDKIKGLSVTINTTARTDEHARALLTAFGLPLRK